MSHCDQWKIPALQWQACNALLNTSVFGERRLFALRSLQQVVPCECVGVGLWVRLPIHTAFAQQLPHKTRMKPAAGPCPLCLSWVTPYLARVSEPLDQLESLSSCNGTPRLVSSYLSNMFPSFFSTVEFGGQHLCVHVIQVPYHSNDVVAPYPCWSCGGTILIPCRWFVSNNSYPFWALGGLNRVLNWGAIGDVTPWKGLMTIYSCLEIVCVFYPLSSKLWESCGWLTPPPPVLYSPPEWW